MLKSNSDASHSKDAKNRRDTNNGGNTRNRRDVNTSSIPATSETPTARMLNIGGKPARAGKQATVGTPWTAVHRKLEGQQQQQIHQKQKASLTTKAAVCNSRSAREDRDENETVSCL
jgi:hypothetical protein